MHDDLHLGNPIFTGAIRLSAAASEALEEGGTSILDAARVRAREQAKAAARWNVTARRARLAPAPHRVDVLTHDGRYLGHEEVAQ